MTYHDVAPFLWLGFSAGCLVGVLVTDWSGALERWLLTRIMRRTQQKDGSQ